MKKKKGWKNFEITKIKLNPEQAVLSCCFMEGRIYPTNPWPMICQRHVDCGGGEERGPNS